MITDHKDNLYYLQGSDNTNYSSNFLSESIDSTKNKYAGVQKWHCRMGHLNLQDLMESNNKGNIKQLNITKLSEEFNCEVMHIKYVNLCTFSQPVRMCH